MKDRHNAYDYRGRRVKMTDWNDFVEEIHQMQFYFSPDPLDLEMESTVAHRQILFSY